MIKVAILTMSDRGARGEREDLSGEAIREVLAGMEAVVVDYQVIPDDVETIVERLTDMADHVGADVIITTGGTGVSPRDVTPEATMRVIQRELPGMAEAMRAESMKKTPNAVLSRAVCGIRGRTLIINLPGSPKAVRENLAAVLPAIPHAVEKIGGSDAECGAG
ncbi:MAG: molybdopterin adenylyltransferase [Nitrospirae bacterium]|nr:molybdopterin adenylyltransferase [Nitrospirota bacterium]MBI5696128.1 molybdopterin adenylyltransferase [Nitrospirota bacterium]